MKIPNTFNCAGFTIKIKIVDYTETNGYANFNDSTNTIKIAKFIKCDGKRIALTKQQQINSFFHELMHCWQFYSGKPFSEEEAQTTANFMQEYVETYK